MYGFALSVQTVLLQSFVKHGPRQIQLLHSFLPISSALSQYLLDKALFLLSQVLPQSQWRRLRWQVDMLRIDDVRI